MKKPIPTSGTSSRGFRAFITCLFLPAAGILPEAQAALHGVNMAGLEFGGGTLPGTQGTHFFMNSAASYQYFGNKGLTLIRLPFLWERLQPTLNGPLDATYLSYITTSIARAKANGGKVILDLHNYGRYGGHVIDNVYGGVTHVSTANLCDVWVKLSAQYKNETGVYAYGIMNEPHDMGTGNWHNISQAVVTAIRNSGDNKQLMISSDGWDALWSWPSYNPTPWISDPANNFKYEAHFYFDHDSSGGYTKTYDQELAARPNYGTIGSAYLPAFTNWLAKHGLSGRGYVGEFGVPNHDPRYLAQLDDFLKACDAANLDTTVWAAGEWWGNYFLSVQPTNHFTTDAFMTPILTKHLGHREVEDLVLAAATDTVTAVDEAAASEGTVEVLSANAVNDYATYTMPVTQAGTYTVLVRMKTNTTRGQFQLAIDGVNQGAVQEQYGANPFYVELNLGTKTFTTAGDKAFKFTVTGKNAASSGYGLCFDYIKLAAVPAVEVIVDNTAAVTTGTWTASTATPGFHGTNYLHDGNTGKGTKTIRFTPNLPSTGLYHVYGRWQADASRAANVPFDITHNGITTTATANQKINNGLWVLLGTYNFNAGTAGNVLIRTTGTTGYVTADAVKFVKQ